MKRRDIYIFSSQNGAPTCFKKSFESSYAPPSTGDVIALGMIGEPKGILKQGIVLRVKTTKTHDEVRIETDASTLELRQCLIPDNWAEVPNISE